MLTLRHPVLWRTGGVVSTRLGGRNVVLTPATSMVYGGTTMGDRMTASTESKRPAAAPAPDLTGTNPLDAS